MSIQGSVNNLLGGAERSIGVYKYFQNEDYKAAMDVGEFAESYAKENANMAKEKLDTTKAALEANRAERNKNDEELSKLEKDQGAVQQKLMDVIATKGSIRGPGGKFANRQQTIDDLTAKRDAYQTQIEGARARGTAMNEEGAKLINSIAEQENPRNPYSYQAAVTANSNLRQIREAMLLARGGSIFDKEKIIRQFGPKLGEALDSVRTINKDMKGVK